MLMGEHAVIYERPCLVTATSWRVRVCAEITHDGLLHLSAPSLGVVDWVVPQSEVESVESPPELRFLYSAVRCMARHHSLPGGLAMVTESEFSSQLGLGSSAAVTVATAAALFKLAGLETNHSQLFSLSYEAVRAVQTVGSGFDLAASVHGGTLYFSQPGPEIVPLCEQSLPLVVGYSGTKADTPAMVDRVAERRKQQPRLTDEIFDGMARLVEEGRQALATQDWERLGKAMSLNQSLLYALDVSTPRLAQLVRLAEEAGAYGAKLSGAGGGDCMIALVREELRGKVERAIESVGGELVPVRTGAPGVRIESGDLALSVGSAVVA
jgi:mevalonate kinase